MSASGKVRILVVDDEPDSRKCIVDLLESEGYAVLSCGNALDALKEIEKDPPDLIVSDVRMPDIDGLELLEKARYLSPATRVILITAYDGPASEIQILEKGADALLRKPFTTAQILEAVKEALAHREAAPEHAEQAHDGALMGALTGIVTALRHRGYGRLQDHLREVLEGRAGRFVEDLADHLRYEEDILFPSLKELRPHAAERLAGIESEHEELRSFARGLAQKVRERDGEGAADVARRFLAALMDHIHREDTIVEELVHPLDFRTAVSLGRRLLERRLRTKLKRWSSP